MPTFFCFLFFITIFSFISTCSSVDTCWSCTAQFGCNVSTSWKEERCTPVDGGISCFVIKATYAKRFNFFLLFISNFKLHLVVKEAVPLITLSATLPITRQVATGHQVVLVLSVAVTVTFAMKVPIWYHFSLLLLPRPYSFY